MLAELVKIRSLISNPMWFVHVAMLSKREKGVDLGDVMYTAVLTFCDQKTILAMAEKFKKEVMVSTFNGVSYGAAQQYLLSIVDKLISTEGTN